MGKEAVCHYQWASESGQAKVLLETHDLILRPTSAGKSKSRTIPIPSLSKVEVEEDRLQFHAGADRVILHLGPAQAQSWARKIATPPPTLAAKLGITPSTQLTLIGEFESEEFKEVTASAATTDASHPSLILANIRTRSDLDCALDQHAHFAGNPPLWLIYPKGPGHPLNEAEIRTTLRHSGFMDTKVASVSATLTALRFIRRDSKL